MTTVGTCHFVSYAAAVSYYRVYEASFPEARRAVNRKLADGEIRLGKPETKAGERLVTIDGGRRYAIEEESL